MEKCKWLNEGRFTDRVYANNNTAWVQYKRGVRADGCRVFVIDTRFTKGYWYTCELWLVYM